MFIIGGGGLRRKVEGFEKRLRRDFGTQENGL
jgi:hypothetical protein